MKMKSQTGALSLYISGKELLSRIFRELQKFQKKKAENNRKIRKRLEWAIHKGSSLNIQIM